MRISGLASNLDWEQLVEQLMQIERRPLLLLERRKLEIETEKNAWSDIRTRLSNLRNRIDDVLAKDLFNGYKATSSHEGVVTVTAGAAAQAGTYVLTVTRLAQAHSIATSIAWADTTTPLGYSGTFQITIGPAVYDVTVDANDSLQAIRDKINQAIRSKLESDPSLEPYGARATIIGGYLVITRTQTGAGSIEISDLNSTVAQDLGLINGSGDENVLVQGQDAEFVIGLTNPLVFTRSSNTVSDVIPGVTLELRKADPATTVEITVSPNDDAVVDALKKFIDQYNSVISFMNQQLDYKDPSGGKLAGDPLLIGLREELRRLVSDVVESIPSDSWDRLFEIGITTVDKSGTLQLDEAKLREALARDRAAVQRLLAGGTAGGGTGDGVLVRLQQRVGAWLQANTGLLDSRIKLLQDRMEDYTEQIERMEYRLQLREQNMLRQFQALESLISTLQSQESWLTQQINQLNALWRPRR